MSPRAVLFTFLLIFVIGISSFSTASTSAIDTDVSNQSLPENAAFGVDIFLRKSEFLGPQITEVTVKAIGFGRLFEMTVSLFSDLKNLKPDTYQADLLTFQPKGPGHQTIKIDTGTGVSPELSHDATLEADFHELTPNVRHEINATIEMKLSDDLTTGNYGLKAILIAVTPEGNMVFKDSVEYRYVNLFDFQNNPFLRILIEAVLVIVTGVVMLMIGRRIGRRRGLKETIGQKSTKTPKSSIKELLRSLFSYLRKKKEEASKR